MDFKITTYILFFVLLFSTIGLKAQNQFRDFEKEKTYVQTSHVFYKPGEEMYFKIYVVKAENNLPADQSRVVNFELIDPSGSVIKKAKYEIEKGYAEGYLYFSDEMKGGIYKIRAFTNWMQNEEGKNAFEKEITLQKVVSPRILMKLEFPKKGYGPGDEVLADFSMRSLSNQVIPFYEADYTVMHNGEIISEGKLITDKEGKKQLKFNLPKTLKSSDALLNIKVNFDGFTESISRNIPIVLNYLDVKFMPEGGTLINGLEQNVAFKILDEYEKPVDAVLEIFNQNKQKVADASAYNFGMGSFRWTPKRGETYYAKVIKPENISQTYQLPEAKDEGVVLNMHKENQKIYVKITSTGARAIVLKGSFREKEIYNQTFSLQKGLNQFEISEKELPAGICRFTVFEGEIPLAERIVFANESRQMNVKIKPVKQQYLPREKVVLDIETTDENGIPVPANLAMSVVDDKLWTYADDKQNNILSWLLMDSELKGKVERPQFYFDKKEEKAAKSLDLLMLTNGYRYFEMVPEVIKNQKYKYLPEKRNPIYGIVEDENRKPVKAEVYLLQGEKVLKQITSEEGTFYFSDLKRNDYYKLIAKSFQPKQQVKIRILSYKLSVNPLANNSPKNVNVEEIVKEAVKETGKIELRKDPEKKIVEQEKTKYIKESRTKRSSGSKGNMKSDTLRSDRIEEVVVTAYGIKKNGLTSGTIISKEDGLQNPDVASLLAGKVSGVMVNRAGGQPGSSGSILIRGMASVSNKTPLYVVDGVPVENFKTAINPSDINSITVLKDAAATSIYGSLGVNGVIIINSVKNSRPQLKVDITPKSYYAVMTVPQDSLVSYSYSRNFQYPVYQSTNTSYRFDYRETIYWNPVLETDKKGKAKVEFYNSDANTAFRIMTEGISGKGLIGRDETVYSAQSLISIDAKIPQYLTRTDQMMIPVVIKNNSAETRKMVMDVIVPNRVKLIKFDSIITLKPLESGRLFVMMQADDVVSSNIQFSIQSGDFREAAIFPFNVEEKGFPHHYSIISNTFENRVTQIPAYINGSFSSSYYVYENTALQLFDDMERLKREPHGCFEQLSSTVYPNIFILDYLKSVKKITPQTESFVIRNMKKGYQKMLSYKNRDGGFGYFNASESDVSVSAFALLEFRDLKKYVDIDPKLIQNLTSFILSKNQNGNFEVRKSYEMRSPFSDYAWSRNMYVIYALAKIGLKNQIEEPYKNALNKALATKDSYQLSLMANASAYLGKTKDYQELMTILNRQYETKNEKTTVTFTGSSGISANAETLSLYIMALQKDTAIHQLKIAEAADKLINYNGYYGFGSTQATTLALEALSDFFAKNEKLYGTEKPKIKINKVEVAPNMSLSSAYRNGQNEIDVEYGGNVQKGLPYKLDYQYYTLQAPESKDIPVTLETRLKSEAAKIGETKRMTVTVKNKINGPLPMVTAKIGIPAGLTLQNALLKDLIDKKQVSYYEIFDNYLVLYWEHFDTEETKVIYLDLKVEFAGEYTGKASNVYLYYMPEAKYWNEGIRARIEP
ncbi:TonB-dependent receptor plug domain-containing protein [Chryseobacterium sp. OSA05B]|uniref:TonB-dependent receptor plug domain-containing protein n=1 Tax=Chryseobacterium sp. OSA05B TaxID=2862650 RepID=UPI001CBF6F35|nr:TonB-dependent receptor plug domain-containing protein [Chryseobacterium sp. OSA05B]